MFMIDGDVREPHIPRSGPRYTETLIAKLGRKYGAPSEGKPLNYVRCFLGVTVATGVQGQDWLGFMGMAGA